MLDGDTVIMTDDGHGGYGLVNHFRHDGDDLVFVEQDSDNFVYVKVKDGEKFHCTGEAFKQNDGEDSTVQIMPNRKLSLNDVIMLSQKGYDLTWSDFDQFKYIETGSGLYIRVYEINEMYELWIGGSWIDEDPMYIYLALADDLDTRIDIRDGGVTDFIGADHSSVLLSKAINEAILTENKPSKPDGLYHCASFVLLDQKELSGTPTVDSSDHTQMVTVYGLALHQGFGYSGGTFHDVSGSHIPVAITFEIVGGKYVLKEYWTPRDGSYYVQDVRDKFPDEVEDEALDIIFQPSARRLNQFPQGYHGFAALSKGNFALSSRTAPHVRDSWTSHPSISLIFTGRPSFMDLVAAAAMRIGARPSSPVTCVSVPLMTASAKALCSAAKAMV